MPIAYDPNTGWSNLLSYELPGGSGGDPYSDSSYRSASGTWFQRSWWTHDRWARKYTNINKISVKLSEMKFLACAGHSNGKRFAGSPEGGQVGPTNGYGCTFTVDLYIVNGDNGNESIAAVSSNTLETINQYNCYYNGYGEVCVPTNSTSFGSLVYFAPGSGYELDTQGHRRYMYEQVFQFTDAPAIRPGHSMFVHVRPTNWPAGSTINNSMLVVKSGDPFFTAIMEPAESPYIWRFDGTRWIKDRYAFKFDGKGWAQLKEE